MIMACWFALFSRVVLIQCWFIASEIQFQISWFQIVTIPLEAPLASLMLPLYYLCRSMTLLISLWFCFVSCNIIILGFLEMIRSLRAATLEGCPSPLMFQDNIFIIGYVVCREVLAPLGPCWFLLCHVVPGYKFLQVSAIPLLCPFVCSHPCAT